MPNPTPSPAEDWANRLDPVHQAADLSAALQELATEDSVSGITRRCLELLDHDDSEVRLWTSESLESAVQPTADETKSLNELLSDLLARQAAGTQGADAPLLADQLYWTATMIGRIGTAAAAADPALARLEALSDVPDATAYHAAAARAGRSRAKLTT
ncbi:hypothetical protein [Allorhodopirellula solitaria]|uniref:HEAT repeat protein n=1 Tax=Allorhodopirellula solitaria TaxID=2527987 RepID=A0A5C5X0N8_9BACT|nr:hypothetical protein [Allorhodopirellula solitaria]TWT56557.1 hypothetical protein CA85_40900 [Allorhodopirellula solitaria]